VSWLGTRVFREFRNRALIRFTAGGVRIVNATCRLSIEGADSVEAARSSGTGAVVATWHENLFLHLAHRSCRDTLGLISSSRDGEFAARVLARFGVRAVRGSPTERGRAAVLELLRAAPHGSIVVITPDGPKGPRQVAKSGVAFLARAASLPVIAAGAAARSSSRLRSWDRFCIPHPFTRIALVFAPPLRIEASTPLAAATALVQEALDRAMARARALAGTT
jgi:lysophospholipid acyltransferase (LPLAT)-like uncharacterized protein